MLLKYKKIYWDQIGLKIGLRKTQNRFGKDHDLGKLLIFSVSQLLPLYSGGSNSALPYGYAED